jgi:hypothetical protein
MGGSRCGRIPGRSLHSCARFFTIVPRSLQSGAKKHCTEQCRCGGEHGTDQEGDVIAANERDQRVRSRRKQAVGARDRKTREDCEA